MAAQSPDTIAKLNMIRSQIRAGEEPSKEDLDWALSQLRGDRAAAAAPTAGSRTTRARSSAKAKPDGDDLLSELDAMG